MDIEALRELSARLNACASGLSALGLALQERAGGSRLDPAVKNEVSGVLVALGVQEPLESLPAADVEPILDEIRMTLLHAAAPLRSPESPGWAFTDGEVLRGTGAASSRFPLTLKRFMSQHEGLSERLESSTASFLDVGVGVAAISISMARTWPNLKVVGIDPWEPSLSIARKNVAAANLSARIELRKQTVQSLEDREVFDLAFFPSFFIPAFVVEEALTRVHQSLRPGGWISFSLQSPGSSALTAALARLRTVSWGGHPWSVEEAESLLQGADYVQVQTLRGPSPSAGLRIIGRRAER